MSDDVWDFVAPIAGAALGSVVPGVGTMLGAAIGSGLNTGISTGNPLAGALSFGGSLAGGGIGQGLSMGAGNVLGSTLGDVAGGALGSTAANALGSLGGQTLGGMVGSTLGSELGGSLGQAINPNEPDLNGTGVVGFSPSKQPAMGLPQSLSQFASLTPDQQTSNIASRGVYGGGQGPEETNYFLNLMNRQLFDRTGNVASDLSAVNPIEHSYLSQLGISGRTPNDVLEGISRYAA